MSHTGGPSPAAAVSLRCRNEGDHGLQQRGVPGHEAVVLAVK